MRGGSLVFEQWPLQWVTNGIEILKKHETWGIANYDRFLYYIAFLMETTKLRIQFDTWQKLTYMRVEKARHITYLTGMHGKKQDRDTAQKTA